MALHTFHGGSSPLQGHPIPAVGWLELGESRFSRFIQRDLAVEAFQLPTLTLKSALPQAGAPPLGQISRDALEDLSHFACLLRTSTCLSVEP